MSKKMYTFALLVLLSTFILGACGSAAATPTAGMPNPASVFCEQNGGTLEIITAADGSQSGLCRFPDGSACDEWAYYRGECAPGATPAPQTAPGMANPAAVFCEEHGGQVEIITAADGSQSGLCRFPDGSTCDEWAYFRGECAPATTPAYP
jgi:putative hemolysin